MQDARDMIATVAGHGGPMLSAYVSVNPAVPEIQGQEYKVRLRGAMNDDLVVRDPEAERCPFCGQQTR